MKSSWKIILLFLIVYTILANYSNKRHRSVPEHSFRSELWADRAGYFVYLPATFLYNFEANQFPQNIEKNTGNGFRLDKKGNKIITKYTSGVALLQAPFFLAAHFYTKLTGNYEPDGFSQYYSFSVHFSGIFYGLAGLFLLFFTLKKVVNCSSTTALITVAILFFGTNLFYYTLVEAGMSHVYSFFLFSSILYLFAHRKGWSNFNYLFFFALFSALIILIRPTNVFFIGIMFLMHFKDFNQSLLSDLRFKDILTPLIIFILVMSPQLIYWQYSSGSMVSYSYKNESFTHLLDPRLLETMFSPNNGMLPFSLILILLIFSMIYTSLKSNVWGKISFMSFLFVWYYTASWHDWQFGCSAGMRNLVEYYPLFALPFVFTYQLTFPRLKKWEKGGIQLITIVLVLVSFKVNYHYFGCMFNSTWNWEQYIDTLVYPKTILWSLQN